MCCGAGATVATARAHRQRFALTSKPTLALAATATAGDPSGRNGLTSIRPLHSGRLSMRRRLTSLGQTTLNKAVKRPHGPLALIKRLRRWGHHSHPAEREGPADDLGAGTGQPRIEDARAEVLGQVR